MNIVPDFGHRHARRSILGFPVHDLCWPHALALASDLASRPAGQSRIAFLNANNANIMLEDANYRDILEDNVVLPDGVGIDIASYVLNGSKFKANLNGTDFVPALLTYIDRKKRVGLIGGTPEVLAGAVMNFKRHAPWHDFIAVSDGYFDKTDSAPVLEKLADLKIDILLVGMGTPLQEKWVHQNIREEHARLVLTVGALFDFVSEIVPRAPQWVRKARLEWIYRIVCEPSRLWRRYIIGGPVFLGRMLAYRFGLSKGVRVRPPANDEHKRSDGSGRGIPSEIAFPLKSMDRRQ